MAKFFPVHPRNDIRGFFERPSPSPDRVPNISELTSTHFVSLKNPRAQHGHELIDLQRLDGRMLRPRAACLGEQTGGAAGDATHAAGAAA